MHKLSPEQFQRYAQAAITLAWQDVSEGNSKPRNSHDVAVFTLLPSERSKLARVKIRQVYGAAWDLFLAQRGSP